jgi:hypothetical protein
VAFGLGGIGNGVVVVHERLLIQSRVPTEIQGRAFSLLDALVSWGFAVAFISAGVAASPLGPRGLLLATAIGEVMVTIGAFVAIGSARRATRPQVAPSAPPPWARE